eukprot:335685_1
MILFILIYILGNTYARFIGQCEEAQMIVEWQTKCPDYTDPLACHRAFDIKRNAYMCEWSDENEYMRERIKQLRIIIPGKVKSSPMIKIIDASAKPFAFQEGDIFWVWFARARKPVIKKKPAPLVKKKSSLLTFLSDSMSSVRSKRTKSKKSVLPPLDYNKYCEFMIYTKGKLVNAFYDPYFKDPEVAKHLTAEPWFQIEMDTATLVVHPLDMGEIIHVRDVQVFSHERGKKKEPKTKKHMETKNVYIRKILDRDSMIWFVVPDGIRKDSFSPHELFFRNFDNWMADPSDDVTLWNQETIFNNLKIVHEKDLKDLYLKPPKGIVWVAGKVGGAQDIKKKRKEWYDMFGANKGADKGGPFDLLKFTDTGHPLDDDTIYKNNFYNDNWWFYASQMNKHFTTDASLNEDEWRGKYERRITALLKETSSKKYGMAFFDDILKQVLIPKVANPKAYKWTHKGKVEGTFTDTAKEVHWYTTESDAVNLWVMGVMHGNSVETAQQLADAMENKAGVFKGIDVVLIEHDLGRLYEQLRGIKQDLKTIFEMQMTKTSDEAKSTKFAFDQMAIAADWFNNGVTQSEKNPHLMEKNVPIISAMRKGIPIVLCDSPTKISYPTLFAQAWDISRAEKGSTISATRDNAYLNWLYRGMWLTQRNHDMVNGINEAVGEFYATFMSKQAPEQQRKAKKNYLMIIGNQHRSAQIASDTNFLALGYKLGMHPMLTNPELFADAGFLSNGQCNFKASPYTKQFPIMVSKYSSHIGYDERYNEYDYDEYGEDDFYRKYDLLQGAHDQYYPLHMYKPQSNSEIFLGFMLLLVIFMLLIGSCVSGCCGALFGGAVIYKYEKYRKQQYDAVN